MKTRATTVITFSVYGADAEFPMVRLNAGEMLETMTRG